MRPEEARARMLRLWRLFGAEREESGAFHVLTTQRTMVRADSLASNAKHSLFAATNLATPLGSYTHAVLRDCDVALIETSISAEQLRALLAPERVSSSRSADSRALWRHEEEEQRGARAGR